MKRTVLAITFTCLCAAGMTAAQTRTFNWDNELCRMTGTYDAAKYSDRRLRNTLSLFLPAPMGPTTDLTVWKFDDISGLNIPAYEREYEERSKKLLELDIVRSPYWQSLRQELLKEMEQVRQLTVITAQAYSRPEAINEYPRAASCKLKYAGPIIAGGESLIAAWREVNLASQKVNADPKGLQARFDRENASPDRLKFALVETMNFGWWNCAVALIERPERASNGKAEKEFRKLFKRVREKCDEP